jgi:hypothetical protein
MTRNYIWVLSIAFAIGIILAFAPGCKETANEAAPTGGSTAGSNGNTIPIDMPIVKVGDSDVKLGDLLFSAQTFWYLEQSLITNQVYFEEARKRGIYPTQADIDTKYLETMNQQGGEEQFLSSLPPSIPKALAIQDMKNNAIKQIIQEALLKDEFNKQHGPITDTELNQLWTDRGESLRPSIASEKGIPPEQVTMEMARTQLEDQIRNQWYSQNAQKFLDDLVASYQVENYLREQYSATHPEDVVVPEVGEEPNSPLSGMIPPAETGGEQTSTGETH